MRTNSSSSFGSTIGFDDVIPSSSSTTTSDCPEFRKILKQYGKFFSTRLIQAVVQSRTNERFDLACVVPPVTPDWFNMCIDELGEVSAQIKRSITRFPPAVPSMSIDFILYTCEGDLLPMESWTFAVDEEDQQGSWTNDVKSQLYHQLGVLLRSSMVAARMTPLHRYYVKKQSADTFVILYKLCEGHSTIELGTDAKRMELGRFPTPLGAFKLELAYRTQMEVERALTPEDGESLNQMSIIFPGTSDMGNVIGSPTPSSYCELMSEFSTSPTSIAATSPVDNLSEQNTKPGRIRSTSLASDGEQPSGSPKLKFYNSSQHIPLNIPFANLLTVSHTGYLYPLPEEIERQKNLKTALSSFIPMRRTLEIQEVTETSNDIPAKDVFMKFITSCNAAKEDDVEPQEVEKLQMLVPAKDIPYLANSQKTVVDEGSIKGDEASVNSVATIKRSKNGGDDLDRTMTPTNESNGSDEDSFVKIPFFGPSNLDPGERSETLRSVDRHLGEFISSVKMPAQLGLSVNWNEFKDLETQLENFSNQQGTFDKFVAEVRESGGQSD